MPKKLFAQIRTEKVIDGIKLIPASVEDGNVLKNYHLKQIVKVEITGIKKPRSYQQLKKYHGMKRFCLKNSQTVEFQDEAAVDYYIKHKVQYFVGSVMINGNLHMIVGSISYSNMEQFIMNGFMDKAIKEFGILVGMTPEEMEEVYQKELRKEHA